MAANSDNWIKVIVPASTSNLGAGFDCFGLALQLYLNVKARIDQTASDGCTIHLTGAKENRWLNASSENLIYRAMKYAAMREGASLPAVLIEIDNHIPVSRGLGGSAAAIVAGIKLFASLVGVTFSNEKILQLATELEGHADNAAPSLFGGFVINCIDKEGNVIAFQRSWPNDIKIVMIVPESPLDTRVARAALSRQVLHADAVFNLQRTALFTAAVAGGRKDLLWEAMQDRLHQQKRGVLLPGLSEALATPKLPGLLGVSLSGAGPSILALVESDSQNIGTTIAANFERQGIGAQVLFPEVDDLGCRSS